MTEKRDVTALPLHSLVDERHRTIKRALAIGQHAEYAKQPPESFWEEAFAAVASLEAEGSWRADAVATSDPTVRDLGDRALAGLRIMRDDDGDEDSWVLPDLVAINSAISAVGALVQLAEDRRRFKNALRRICKEWNEQNYTPGEIREFARSVIAGATARSGIRQNPPAAGSPAVGGGDAT